jgi:hypothetical protein
VYQDRNRAHALPLAGGDRTCPRARIHPGVNAGMTFTMLRSVEPFLQGTSERILMRERLTEQEVRQWQPV